MVRKSRGAISPRVDQARSRGQILIESAVALMILFLVLLAIVEAGRLLQVHQVLVTAAREGAHLSVKPAFHSSVLATVAEIEAEVDRFLRSGAMDPNLANISINQAKTYGTEPTVYSEVTVTYPYEVVTLALFTDLQVTLTGTSAMRNETSP